MRILYLVVIKSLHRFMITNSYLIFTIE